MTSMLLLPESVHQGDLILVSARHPYHPLPPQDLVPVAGTEVLLERRAAQALDDLMATIGGGWSAIVPVSGWRSQQEQQQIWDDSLAENGLAFTQTYVAQPGCSEHQTGLAIDLGLRSDQVDFLRPDFPYQGICQDFRREMARFGLIQRYPAGKEAVTGIGHEPWHFRYVGTPHAAIMAEKDWTLEEYIAWLRSFPCGNGRACEQEAALSFLPAAAQGPTPVDLPKDCSYSLSGNNVDGFVLAEWGRCHG